MKYITTINKMKYTNTMRIYYNTKSKKFIIKIKETGQRMVFDIYKDEYVDLNPLKLSLYADENSKAKKVSDEMYYPWILKKDTAVLNIFLTEDEYVTGSYYKEMWNKYTIDIDNLESYKFGWEISFEVNNNLIHKKILKPSDAEEFYDYLEIYLYDCVNHEINE